MGDVHRLILAQGVEAARAASDGKLDRQCVDTAFAVLGDEKQRIGIMHAGFAMTALPHKQVVNPLWTREGGSVRLQVESGRDAGGNVVGIPFGSVARLILLYLQSEAIRTKSREIELGRSMNYWLKTMGVDNGGKNYKIVREQSKRISLCRLTFYRITASATAVTNGSFVRDAIIPTTDNIDQSMLWQEVVRLDEGFYQSLVDHAMPLQETAIKQLAGKSTAIDIYVWLAYRLRSLQASTPISWAALYQQFGAEYAHLRQFRARFRDPLSLALAAYPAARVEESDTGLILHPSEPPVPERKMISLAGTQARSRCT